MPKMRLPFRREEGFNLVSILIGIALLSVVVLLASRAFVTTKQMKQSLKSGENYSQVQDVLMDSLKTFVKTNVISPAVPCANPQTFFATHAFLRHYTGNLGTARSSRPSGIDDRAWNEAFNQSLNAGSFAGAALNRCPQSDLGNNGRIHFCLNIVRDANAPKDSILRSPFAFMEVAVQLYDLQAGSPLDCSKYLDPNRNSGGASVDYLIVWLAENGSRLELKKKNGSFYVNK